MQVVCGYCGWTIDADGRKPGEVLACPRCGQDVRVPRLEEDDDCEPAVGFAEQVREAMKSAPTARVTCGGCGHSFTVGLRMCGRAVRCPSCRAVVRIPYPDEPDEAHKVRPAAAGESVPSQQHKPADPGESGSPDVTGAGRLRKGWVCVLLAAAVLVAAALAALIIIG
ncbi:MAG: hypothetical protein ACP5HU_01430 [Phycisphaerae bacterium]